MEKRPEYALAIRSRIRKFPRGRVFRPGELIPYGPRACVDQVLLELVRNGEIRRLARGVFARPRLSPLVGEVLPGAWEVAEAIVRSEGGELEIHGAEAARKLGLSTQMQVRPVFYTTARSRTVRLESGGEVTLQHVAARRLAFRGTPVGLALNALWYLGREHVTAEVMAQISRKLPTGAFEKLCDATAVMPGWMAKAVATARGRLAQAA